MQAVYNSVLPVMLVVLLGYGLARAGRPVEGELLRFLVVRIGSPALIFTALVGTEQPSSALLQQAAAAAAGLAVFAAAGWLLLRSARWPVRAFLPSLMFGNTGNLGLPLSLYAFGPLGLGCAAVVNTVNLIGNFIIGQSIAFGRADLKSVLLNPSLIAAVLGLVLAGTHQQLPVWLKNTLQMPANFTIPLLLLMLGTALATIRIHRLGRTLVIAAARIGIGTAAGYALAALFALDGVPRTVFILQMAMPAAVYNYLFALAGKSDPDSVASVVVASTLMSVISIPLLMVWLA